MQLHSNKLTESFGLTKLNDMSTLFNERTPFDLLFRNLFKADGAFQPTTFENKQPHPLDIFYDDEGLHFEVACTGLTKKDVILDIEGDILKISYKKPKEEKIEQIFIKHSEKKKIINHPQIDSAYFCDLLLKLNGFTFRKN